MGLDGPNAAYVILGGGIGAGKSTVAEIFVEEGFHLIAADEVGAEILGPGADATKVVARQWPTVYGSFERNCGSSSAGTDRVRRRR